MASPRFRGCPDVDGERRENTVVVEMDNVGGERRQDMVTWMVRSVPNRHTVEEHWDEQIGEAGFTESHIFFLRINGTVKRARDTAS